MKNNKTLKMYIKTILYKLICVLVGFLNSILINRSLGVALRGEYTSITNWASLIQLFLNLGIGTIYPSIKRENNEEAKSIISTLLYMVGIMYLVLIIILFPFLSTKVRYIAILSYLLTLENIILFVAIVEDVSKKNFINIITSILHTVVLFIIYYSFKRNLDMIILAVFLDHILLSLLLVANYKITIFDRGKINKSLLKSISYQSFPAMLMNMLMYLNYHADILFLSSMTKNSVQVGLYGTAVSLGNMLWIIPDAFKDILYNRSTKRDNPKEIKIAILINIVICIFVIIGFIFLGKWFLITMYGEEYLNSYGIALIIFIGTIPMILYKLIHPIYIANGKTSVVVILLLIAVITNILGNIILIPQFEGIGAALSSVISYSICGIAFYLRFVKDYNKKRGKLNE